MKKMILAAVAVLALAACEKEIPPIDDPTDEPQKVSENFTFKSIEFLFDDKSETEFVTKKVPTFTLHNGGSLDVTYYYDSRNSSFNRSTFWSSDERAFKLVGEEPKVKIPWHISETGVEIGQEEWNYAEGDQRRKPSTWSASDIIVPPHHVMTLNESYRYKTLSTRYRLHLKGVEEGEEITVDGWWTGMFLDSIIETDIDIEPMD